MRQIKHTRKENPFRAGGAALSMPVDPVSSLSLSLVMIVSCFCGRRAVKQLELLMTASKFEVQTHVPGAGVGPSSSSTSSMVGE
jgi:hypothetical protein